jgi:hypothetical protein
MDKKSKVLLIVFGLLIILMVGATYWRIMIKKDYIVEAQTDCDPYVKKCFVWECDPESTVEGEACTGDAEKDIWYYNIVKRNAGRIPLCDPATDENCTALVCGENEPECEQIFCDDKTKVEQGVECNDPVKYTEENPIEEESVECEEGDMECEAQQNEDAGSAESGEPISGNTGSQTE